MKRKIPAICAILSVLLCSACGTVPEVTTANETTAATTTEATTTAFVPGTLAETSATSAATDSKTDTSTEGTTASAATTPPTTSETSSETTEPYVAVPYAYSFDPYDISSEYARLYGDSFLEVYRGLADAFINYETECFCPDEETFTALLGCLDSSMPYFSSDAILTYDSFDADKQTLTIHYLSSSQGEHDAAYHGFINAVKRYVEGNIFAGDSPLVQAISLYRAFTSSVTYDLSANDVSAYSAIVNRSGIAHSFAGAYAYLLRQVGIDAVTCGGLSMDGSAAHEWVAFNLGGSWFYADPTYENGETGGLGLSYFGTNNTERKEAGYDPEFFGVGTTGQLWASELGADGNQFDFFRGSTAFEIDRGSNTLGLSNGIAVEIDQLPGGQK